MAATDQVLEVLRGKIRERMNHVTDAMAEGGCKSFPDYTRATGIIEGLALAERELLDLDQSMQAQ